MDRLLNALASHPWRTCMWLLPSIVVFVGLLDLPR